MLSGPYFSILSRKVNQRAVIREAQSSTHCRLRLCALAVRRPTRRSRSHGLRLRRPLGLEHLTGHRRDRSRRGILGEQGRRRHGGNGNAAVYTTAFYHGLARARSIGHALRRVLRRAPPLELALDLGQALQPGRRRGAALRRSLYRGRAGRGGGLDGGAGDDASAGIRLGHGHFTGGGASGGLRLGLGHLAGGETSAGSRGGHSCLAGDEASAGGRLGRLTSGRAGYSGVIGGGIASGGSAGHSLGGGSGGRASTETPALADALDHRLDSVKWR